MGTVIGSLKDAGLVIPPGGAVLCTGGFDPLHVGHVRFFKEAAWFGKTVVVAVAPDSYVERKHPVFQPLELRMEMLAGVRWIEFVVPQEEESAASAILAVRPAVFFKGRDWYGKLPEKEQAALDAVGGELRWRDVDPYSSSDLLRSYFWREADAISGRS